MVYFPSLFLLLETVVTALMASCLESLDNIILDLAPSNHLYLLSKSHEIDLPADHATLLVHWAVSDEIADIGRSRCFSRILDL